MIIFSGKKCLPEVFYYPYLLKIEIKGRCFSNEYFNFFQNINSWLLSTINNTNNLTIIFDLDYFSKETINPLLELLLKLSKISKDNNKLILIWKYEEGDEKIQSYGEYFKDSFEIPLEMKSYKRIHFFKERADKDYSFFRFRITN